MAQVAGVLSEWLRACEVGGGRVVGWLLCIIPTPFQSLLNAGVEFPWKH